MAGCGVAAAPPHCLCVASALRACSKSVPKCRKSGIESKERMSLRSKQIVKRKRKKKGGEGGKSQSFICWECQVALLLGAEVLAPTRR